MRRVVQSALGDWSHYARAPLLRLQHECREKHLRGMDCMVAGNIRPGSGLSSSSALVVGFAESAVALNQLDVTMRDLVDLCGEGEWFAGPGGGGGQSAGVRASGSGGSRGSGSCRSESRAVCNCRPTCGWSSPTAARLH